MGRTEQRQEEGRRSRLRTLANGGRGDGAIGKMQGDRSVAAGLMGEGTYVRWPMFQAKFTSPMENTMRKIASRRDVLQSPIKEKLLLSFMWASVSP